MESSAVTIADITKVSAGIALSQRDMLAVEEPLEIQILYSADGKRIQKSISVTMRTPGNDEELAAGFLFTEGIIKQRNELAGAIGNGNSANTILLSLTEEARPSLHSAERNFYTTSSCGVCGKSSIDAIRTVSAYKDAGDDVNVAAGILYGLQNTLREQQAVFSTTGGLHASAIFNTDGSIISLREDVGRHNALDKLIGAAFLNGDLPLGHVILLLSGRASFELVQKATMAGIKFIAAVGAPSSLAVELAEDCGITLVGFLRQDRFNIYSHPQRIIHEDPY